ncbi:HMG box domain-containing protein [Mycena kentingensis (nom. inval.)]|nr:HMG box domain-containing protein [Mycena kentingensis (nom. inval.)]
MAGPTRTSRKSPPTANTNPPRPPNAWILYRSEKAKDWGRMAQGDISKQISHMWKNESPAVRAEYERRADIKKAEHQAKYPEYRFQPLKKEEKERIRQEKRADKERAKQLKHGRVQPEPGPMPEELPAHPAPNYEMYDKHGIYGPSPPMSAAASPESSYVELPGVDSFPHTPVSAYASPAIGPSSYAAPEPVPAQNPVNGWQPQPDSQYVEFDIPNTPYDQSAWNNPTPSDFDNLFASTGDANVFQLQGFDAQSLLQHPEGNLEISFPPFDLPFDSNVMPLSDLGLFAQPHLPAQDDFAALFALAEPQSAPENFGQEFVNFDGPSEAPPSAPTQYVPPSGASHSSSRRVGGTWARAPSPLTSPIDPGSNWTVHA